MPEFDLNFWKELDKKIPGWMSEEEARFLVENVVGDSYLEIGVAFGKSLRVVNHHYPDMEVLGIDLINHGIPNWKNVVIDYGDANQKSWFENDETYSTVFIDGDHTYKGCLSDFVHWYNKVKPGGMIIFHDYGRPTREHEGIAKAVDAIKPLLEDFKSTNYIACGRKPN